MSLRKDDLAIQENKNLENIKYKVNSENDFRFIADVIKSKDTFKGVVVLIIDVVSYIFHDKIETTSEELMGFIYKNLEDNSVHIILENPLEKAQENVLLYWECERVIDKFLDFFSKVNFNSIKIKITINRDYENDYLKSLCYSIPRNLNLSNSPTRPSINSINSLVEIIEDHAYCNSLTVEINFQRISIENINRIFEAATKSNAPNLRVKFYRNSVALTDREFTKINSTLDLTIQKLQSDCQPYFRIDFDFSSLVSQDRLEIGNKLKNIELLTCKNNFSKKPITSDLLRLFMTLVKSNHPMTVTATIIRFWIALAMKALLIDEDEVRYLTKMATHNLAYRNNAHHNFFQNSVLPETKLENTTRIIIDAIKRLEPSLKDCITSINLKLGQLLVAINTEKLPTMKYFLFTKLSENLILLDCNIETFLKENCHLFPNDVYQLFPEFEETKQEYVMGIFGSR